MNYRTACKNLGIPTIVSVERQIERFNPSSCKRQELLSLKGETVSAAHMEALEEIFRKVQFDTLDFEYTFLDDDVCSSHICFIVSFLFRIVKNILFQSSSLQMLNLRYTSLSEKPLSALCRVLRGTPQPILSCLHLENVNLHGRNLCNLVCALKFNTMLKELYLGENNLQSTDGTHLHHLIINNSTLQMLDLRNNQLTDAGLVKICEALRNPDVIKNSSITALVLWNNKLTGSGMDAIAGALCTNFHLETLNIGSNMIGELGIQRLKSALGCNNSNLRRLGLQNTQMNCQSTILLAECLADNTSMVRVDLRDNPGIGSAGLLALHSAMKINSSISLLNLDQSCVVTTNVKVSLFHHAARLALQQSLQTGSADEKITSTPKIEESVVENGKPEHSKKVLETVVNVESPSYCHLPTTETNFGSKGKFLRSSSLTCNETVSDIHERIRVMGGSTHSLDEINNDSTKTIKRCAVTPHNSLGLAEWSSLPAIPQTCLSVKPTVRKLRRFSISPSSSSFDVTSNTQISAAHNSEDIATSAEMSHNHLEYSAFLYDDSIKDVRVVVNDLVNYVVYEENAVIERKRSLLLQTTSFPVSELVGLGARCKNDLTTRRISLPRIVNVTETVEETEDSIVAGVVRTLVREILRLEKEDLRNTLDRRRKRSGLNLPSNLV
ncbi:leucine Rich repeat-containing domain protein [Dictyocaulus viviparus]|uniref:Leucine Rich repeat-containing domain protein n=1 Tax=Dictyocaulus viviparus TaxID=29172 RepID=A0A0D8XKK2_DICVI|nr:leucine Rich repeat-containing domain protein [Dictyocaulus viviparus]